jgi:hypothetical protein
MLMMICGLPKCGSFGKVEDIHKHCFGIRIEMQVLCRETIDSIVEYYKFDLLFDCTFVEHGFLL